MKRASYRAAIKWIARNDEGAETDPVVISELVSVCLTADLFDVDPMTIAQEVLNTRAKENRA